MNWLQRRILESWYRAPGSPLFAMKARRLGWPRTGAEFQRYGLMLLGGGGVIALIWMASGDFFAFANLMYFLVALNLGLTVAADLFYMLVAVSSIQRQIATGQWDELRLTHLSIDDMLWAEQGIAEIRGWRLTIAQIASRSLLIFVPLLKVIAPLTPDYFSFVFVILIVPAAVVTAPLWLLFCVFEPVWELQTVSSLGVAIAARSSNQTTATLAGLGAIFALRLGEIVVLATLFYIMFQVLVRLQTTRLTLNICGIYFYLIIYLRGVFYLTHAYHRWVQRITPKPLS